MKKIERKDKNEKRRLVIEKQNARKEKNMMVYGADHGAAVVAGKTANFNRRFLAALMAMVFVLSTLVVGVNFAGKAEDGTEDSHLVLNKYLTLNNNGNYDLTLEAYANGTSEDYTITEKLPTDFVVIVDQSGSMSYDDMPAGYSTVSTDVNLETIATSSDRYYYKADDGKYYRVYAKKGYLYYKYAANTYYSDDYYGKNLFYYFSRETSTASGASGYYYYDSSDKKWYPVSMRVSGESITGGFQYKCYYTYNKNGTSTALPYSSSKSYHSYRQVAWQRITDVFGITMSDKIVHDLYKRRIGYTMLCYQDADGIEHKVPTTNGTTSTNYMNSTSNTSDPSSFPSNYYSVTGVNGTTRMLYNTGSSNIYKATGNNTRLSVLKYALNQFAEAVADETDSFGTVDNKISIVGFSDSSSGTNNTEILTNESRTSLSDFSTSTDHNSVYLYPDGKNYNGTQYSSSISTATYAASLVSASDGNGNVSNQVSAAINAITANGGTQPEYGFYMAEGILNNRSTKTYTYRSGDNAGTTVPRNTFVIYFTDGRPGDFSYSNQYSEANDVVSAAKAVKALGAKVFSIGVFDESDGNPLTYRKSSTSYSSDSDDAIYDLDFVEAYKYNSSTYYYLYRMWLDGQQTIYGSDANDTIYDYMSVVSSNYPNATKFMPLNSSGQLSTSAYKTDCDALRGEYNGTNDYYRMASNQDTLVAAFESIVTNVSNGSTTSTTSAGSTAILQDVINTSDFTLDENPTVTYGTVTGTAHDNGNITFDEETYTQITDGSVRHTISGSIIDVTGFDYAENCISYQRELADGSKTDDGKMLRVTISGVSPNSNSYGTLLSSNVALSSGIYEADTNGNPIGDPLETFNLPQLIRYKYTMNVTDADADAIFDVDMALANATDATNDFSKVCVVNGNTRTALGQNGIYSWTEVNAGDELTLEYITSNGTKGAAIPSTYTLSATVTPTSDDASSYTYYLDTSGYVDLVNPDSSKTLPRTVSLSTVQNGNLFVDSNANTCNASLTLSTEGTFANTSREFPIGMTITGYSGDITLGNGSTLTFVNGALTNPDPDALKLKNGDTVTFTDLPANSTVTITPSDDPGNAYTWTVQLDEGQASGTATTGTIDQDGHVFHVVYTRGEITDSGILDDDSPNALLLIFAGMIVISGIVATVYVYRKEDELSE